MDDSTKLYLVFAVQLAHLLCHLLERAVYYVYAWAMKIKVSDCMASVDSTGIHSNLHVDREPSEGVSLETLTQKDEKEKTASE
jgi:hypothetical protein